MKTKRITLTVPEWYYAYILKNKRAHAECITTAFARLARIPYPDASETNKQMYVWLMSLPLRVREQQAVAERVRKSCPREMSLERVWVLLKRTPVRFYDFPRLSKFDELIEDLIKLGCVIE